MFFAKYIALLTLPILAAATPMPGGSPTTNPITPTTTIAITATSTATEAASGCDTSSLQCCQSTTTSSDPGAEDLLGLLGVVLGADVPVGLTCTPIPVLGGDSCAEKPVCCEDNSYNGVIALGCVPVNLSL